MGESLTASSFKRLASLDAFRGMTIAAMVLVNNPGTWGAMFPPLKHAPWHGWTPTDWIFPFFLFIVGVAMTFSFDKRLAAGESRLRLFEQVIRRTVILFCLGLILSRWRYPGAVKPYVAMVAGLVLLYWDEPVFKISGSVAQILRKIAGYLIIITAIYWWWGNYSSIGDNGKYFRVPGVLQRIALCYFFASLIQFFTGTRGRILWIIGLLASYWLILLYIPAPAGYTTPGPTPLPDGARTPGWDAPADAPFRGELNDWIDVTLLGPHLYSHRPDPEGLLSTIPAIATVLLGLLLGAYLKGANTTESRTEKAAGMFAAATTLVLLGWVLSWWMPINKKIWTSSYVILMAGFAMQALALCYYLIDVRGYRKWAGPFLVFGTNPILLFFASGIMARVIASIIQIPTGPDKSMGLKNYTYRNGFLEPLQSLFGEAPQTAMLASLSWSIAYLFLWLLILTPLYKKKIFLKV